MAKMNKTPDVRLDASRKTILKNSLQESRKISLGHLPSSGALIDSLGGVGGGGNRVFRTLRTEAKDGQARRNS